MQEAGSAVVPYLAKTRRGKGLTSYWKGRPEAAIPVRTDFGRNSGGSSRNRSRLRAMEPQHRQLYFEPDLLQGMVPFSCVSRRARTDRSPLLGFSGLKDASAAISRMTSRARSGCLAFTLPRRSSGVFAEAVRRGSVADREPLPDMPARFQLVDHCDGEVFHRDPALALVVDEQLVLAEAELARALAGLEQGRRGE
jgi:hypothetical protein